MSQTDAPPPDEPTTGDRDPYDRRVAIVALLENEDTLLGRTWRYEQEGLDPQQMTDREGQSTTGWVYSYRKYLRVVLEEEIPEAPIVASRAGGKIRTWLKNPDLEPRLREDLGALEAVLRSRADDRHAFDDEVARAVQTGIAAEASGTPGVYVYTLPHYLKYPVDEESGRTLLKVGHSARDAYYRAGSQKRLTALPEEPILLRIYPAKASSEAEAEFHGWLRDADHPNGRGRRSGSEWFVTSTKFLDRIARSLTLEVREINSYSVGDE